MIWACLGALAAIMCEALYRLFPRLPWSWWLPVTLPLMLLINYSIWRILTSASSLIGGVVIFSIAVALIRAWVSFSLGEQPHWQDWIALGLILMALGVRSTT